MLKASIKILRKLKDKHNVEWYEVEEAFANGSGEYLEDMRTEHQTNPPTVWFIAVTNSGRLLKVILIEQFNGDLEIKSAFEPSKIEVEIYEEQTKY
jgi:uncharacterized DUF497 family protein